MKEQGLFYKIKKFFSKIFHSDRKLLESGNSIVSNKSVADSNISNISNNNTTLQNEKDKIFELYNNVKLGKVNLMDIPKTDMEKLISISNEEIKILERTYREGIDRINQVS